ncbi:alpha/beta fold hydrolase [Fundicoccus culcitae]|uniref:Alpha/beta hydrolase n=1 Tax=Fundicoccus culcitae TaxID=2969821 RepID=A0ABY5P8A3_9LACT|nr:alpha/beta hydrolase [Fundicoccus culcitae]UUX34977.1 alpha/beta hydrolase [Fundicoccus culcitae]
MLFNFRGQDIYYEVHGEGTPLLVLNGLMMTTNSWTFMVETLSERYQLILVDMLDQGQSAAATDDYTQADQVELIKAFLDFLTLETVNIMGISYGSEVAIQFTVKYGSYVNKLFLSNACPNTNDWLKDIGRSWIEAMQSPLNFYLSTIPIIYSPAFYNNNQAWFKKRQELLLGVFSQPGYLERMKRLITSAESYDSRSELHKITQPTYILGASHDLITPLDQQRELYEAIENAQFSVIQSCGHASMYEKPQEFLGALIGFLETPAPLSIV